ncbi:hypothetical protein BGZ95_006222 [Linnemannia exigua]|uniref:Uncharacterized protein n=1 Tax=Linnemannia exigua TaxID=604196 RepID=A0AAD4DLA9_9FUNG|nr:hypothetical protein BGZ95_006222 [Linnemannia exigua]
MQLDLEGANDDLVSAQEELEDTRSKFEETELKLQNTQGVLAAGEEACRAASRDHVIARPDGKQEVFAVLKFRHQFIAKNSDLDAVEMDELRFNRSPRSQYVYQNMMDDKHAPINFSRRKFVVKDGHAEDEMKTLNVVEVFEQHLSAL